MFFFFFFFNDPAPPEIYTLPLHDALPICRDGRRRHVHRRDQRHDPAPLQRHHDPGAGGGPRREIVGNPVGIGADHREREDDRGVPDQAGRKISWSGTGGRGARLKPRLGQTPSVHSRLFTPSPRSTRKRSRPPSVVAPANGSSTVSAAPSRSA